MNTTIKQDIFISTKYLSSIALSKREKEILYRLMPFANKGMIKATDSIVRSIAFQLGMDHEDADKDLRTIKSKRKSFELNDRGKVFKRALKDTWEVLRG